MREHKFRAWIDNEMVELPLTALQYFDFEGSYALSFVVDGYAEFWAHEHYGGSIKERCKNAPIMEFTGRQDKNGKDIFESDIVRTTFYNHAASSTIFLQEVVFEYGSFNAKSKEINIEDSRCNVPLYWCNIIEVVGNKYENPELLEQIG